MEYIFKVAFPTLILDVSEFVSLDRDMMCWYSRDFVRQVLFEGFLDSIVLTVASEIELSFVKKLG